MTTAAGLVAPGGGGSHGVEESVHRRGGGSWREITAGAAPAVGNAASTFISF
ncbi:hypothetical protein M5E06_20810 [Azospirillum sp. A1-3]|uniref:hypothetical protein n=1 Tax=Azospirillum sp. A1-3 TaxID=185874 RepID=UPI002076F3CE|nr:hypothetical protein [Azospirillum sp. A1-3]MCM8736572.1 hypothetical protein [Azospirillum sp. A1-3]